MFVQMPGFLGMRMVDDVNDGDPGGSMPYIAPTALQISAPVETDPGIAIGETVSDVIYKGVNDRNGTWVTVVDNSGEVTGVLSEVFVPFGTPIYGWVPTSGETMAPIWAVVDENNGPPASVGDDWIKVQPPAAEYEWGSAPAPAPVYIAPWSQVDDVSQIAPTLPRAVDVIQDLSPPPAVAPVAQIPTPAPAPAPSVIPVTNSGGGGVTLPGQFYPAQTVPRQTALPAVDDYASADGAPTMPGQSQASGGFGMLLAVAGLLLSNS